MKQIFVEIFRYLEYLCLTKVKKKYHSELAFYNMVDELTSVNHLLIYSIHIGLSPFRNSLVFYPYHKIWSFADMTGRITWIT